MRDAKCAVLRMRPSSRSFGEMWRCRFTGSSCCSTQEASLPQGLRNRMFPVNMIQGSMPVRQRLRPASSRSIGPCMTPSCRSESRLATARASGLPWLQQRFRACASVPDCCSRCVRATAAVNAPHSRRFATASLLRQRVSVWSAVASAPLSCVRKFPEWL
jgi:hypothetical protein